MPALQTGDIVNYHSIIGGSVTSEGHEITFIDRAPNNFGCDVAWIAGKSGCVAIAEFTEEQINRSKQMLDEIVNGLGDYAS